MLYRKEEVVEEPTAVEDMDNNQFELSVVERNVCKENFAFYDKARQGFVERFELPMILTGKLRSSSLAYL